MSRPNYPLALAILAASALANAIALPVVIPVIALRYRRQQREIRQRNFPRP